MSGTMLTLFCLVHGDNPAERAFSVKTSATNTVDELKKLIKAEKTQQFASIDADELTLWKVNVPSNELDTLDSKADVQTLGVRLSPLDEVQEVFSDGVKHKHLHIVVVRPSEFKVPSVPSQGKKRKADDTDMRGPYYDRLENESMPSPSSLAHPKRFKRFQEVPHVLNYRPPEAVGLPITLCDPILAKFHDNISGNVELDDKDITFVMELSHDMCLLTFQDEGARRDCFQRHLSKYLSRSFANYSLGNSRETDGSIMHVWNGSEALMMNLEVKPELGMGNGCAYIQSSIYYIEFIKRFRGNHASKRSRLPALLLYLTVALYELSGPYVGIAGAVFLDKPVCEPLTPVMPLFYLPHNHRMILDTARMFKSLNIALAELDEYYSQLTEPDGQLTFPYFNNVANGKLTYINKLPEGRYVFRATLETGLGGRDVIVKFVRKYSWACHKACYEMGIAPEPIASAELAGGWLVVVMEFLADHTTLFSLAKKGELSRSLADMVEESIKRLHDKGFVHGDLRLPNIVVRSADSSVKIIDFDWAGEIGKTVYPPCMNPDIKWHRDVRLGGKIQPEHDMYMLQTEFGHLLP